LMFISGALGQSWDLSLNQSSILLEMLVIDLAQVITQ
jgi:hypothetical protein